MFILYFRVKKTNKSKSPKLNFKVSKIRYLTLM